MVPGCSCIVMRIRSARSIPADRCAVRSPDEDPQGWLGFGARSGSRLGGHNAQAVRLPEADALSEPRRARQRATARDGSMSANRELMERYWAAAEANDLDAMHQLRDEALVVDFPQTGERLSGRDVVRAFE